MPLALCLLPLAFPGLPAAERLTFEAGRVEADAALTDVTLSRHVDVRYDRYRLRSERLHLRVEHGVVVFDGDARLAFCPCPDPPLVLAASGGRFTPPGDVFLRFPRVEIGTVPVLALPFLWLRAPDQVGLLPPLVALRGTDGLLLGGGVHLPFRGDDGAVRAIDLSAGGYTAGGAEASATVTTPDTFTRAVVDRVHGTRVETDARGALQAPGNAAVAWDLDALRGDRALSGTVDLGPAALPFDTGAAEASLRADAGPVRAVLSGGVLGRALRGEGPIAAGPRAGLSLGGPIAGLGSWSADAGGVVLGGAAPSGGLPLGRAAAGAEIDARPGPFELRASAGGRARFAGDDGDGPARELAAAARVSLALPFARTFPGVAGADGEAPLVHWVSPELSIRGALADQRGTLFTPLAGAVPSASWIAAGGLSTSLGRYAGPALRLDARAGTTGDASGTVRALGHARLGADGRVAGVAVEAAVVGERVGGSTAPDAAGGEALLVRARLGADDGPSIRLDTAAQGGAGAGEARAVAAGAWAALPGDTLAYLSKTGVTVGAELAVPWARAFRTAARADVDLASGTLLSVRGLAEYRHPCGCFGLGLLAAHRAGRDGVDVALDVEIAPEAARRARP